MMRYLSAGNRRVSRMEDHPSSQSETRKKFTPAHIYQCVRSPWYPNMPAYPDEYLPPHTVGLQEFILAARDLSDSEDDGHAFMQYILAGRVDIAGEAHRLFLNPTLELDAPEDPTVSGDFDSLIGLTPHLPFTAALSIHAVPPFRDTLTTDVHLTYPIQRGVSVCPSVVLSTY